MLPQVVWSPDGTKLASGSEDCTVKVWDAASGEQLFELHGHSHRVRSVAWSPDGSRLASGSVDGTVRVWEGLSDGQEPIGKNVSSLAAKSSSAMTAEEQAAVARLNAEMDAAAQQRIMARVANQPALKKKQSMQEKIAQEEAKHRQELKAKRAAKARK